MLPKLKCTAVKKKWWIFENIGKMESECDLKKKEDI